MALTEEKRRELETNLTGFMKQNEMRQAVEIGQDSVLESQREFYNINDAATESMKIKTLLDNADDIRLDVKQQDHIRAMYNRNENFLLVNKTKLGGDSDAMRLVKDNIKAYEELIQVNTQGDAAVMAYMVDSTKTACENVISSCEDYLARGRSIFFWRWGRYNAVQKAKERFEKELKKLEKFSTESEFAEYKDDLKQSDTVLSLIIDESLTRRVSHRKSMEKRNTEYNNSAIQAMYKANSDYTEVAFPIRKEINDEDKKANPALFEVAVGMAVLSKKDDGTSDYGSASDYINTLKYKITEDTSEEEKINKIKRIEEVLFAISNLNLTYLLSKDLKSFYGKDHMAYRAVLSIAANCDGIMSMYEELINKKDPALALDKNMFDRIKAKKNALLDYKGRIDEAEHLLNSNDTINQDIQAKSKLSDIRGGKEDYDDYLRMNHVIRNNKARLDIRLNDIAFKNRFEEQKKKEKEKEKENEKKRKNVNVSEEETIEYDDGSQVINEIREKLKEVDKLEEEKEKERHRQQELELEKLKKEEEELRETLEKRKERLEKEKEQRQQETQGELNELKIRINILLADKKAREEEIRRLEEEKKRNEERRMRIQREKEAARSGGARIREALDDRIKKGQASDKLDDMMSEYKENLRKEAERAQKERERIQREIDAARSGGARIYAALNDKIAAKEITDSIEMKMALRKQHLEEEEARKTKELVSDLTQGLFDKYFEKKERDEKSEKLIKDEIERVQKELEQERLEEEEAQKNKEFALDMTQGLFDNYYEKKERDEKSEKFIKDETERAQKELEKERKEKEDNALYESVRDKYLSLPDERPLFKDTKALWGNDKITIESVAIKNKEDDKELSKIREEVKNRLGITKEELKKRDMLDQNCLYISFMSEDVKEKVDAEKFIRGVQKRDESLTRPYIMRIIKEVGAKLPSMEMITPQYMLEHQQEIFELHNKVKLLGKVNFYIDCLRDKGKVFYAPLMEEWNKFMALERELSKLNAIDLGYGFESRSKTETDERINGQIDYYEKDMNKLVGNEAGVKTSIKYELTWNPFVANKLDKTRKNMLKDPNKEGVGALFIDMNQRFINKAKEFGKKADPQKGEEVAIKLYECGFICQEEGKNEEEKDQILLNDAIAGKEVPVNVAIKQKLIRIQKMALNIDQALANVGQTPHQNTRFMELIQMNSQVEKIKEYYPKEYEKFADDAKKVIDAQLVAIKLIGKAALLLGELHGTKAEYDEKTQTFKEAGPARDTDTVLTELKQAIDAYHEATKEVVKANETNKAAEAARYELQKEKMEAEEAKMKTRIAADKAIQKHLSDRKKAIHQKRLKDEKQLSKVTLSKLKDYEKSNTTKKTEEMRKSEAEKLRNDNLAARDIVATLRMDAPMELRKKLNYLEYGELTDVCLLKEGNIEKKKEWQHELMTKYALAEDDKEHDEALSMMLSEIKKISVKPEDMTDEAILKNSARLEDYSKALYSYNILMQRNPKFRAANKKELDPILMVQKARLDYFRIRRTLLCNPTWQKTGAKGLGAAITDKDDIFGRQAKRLFLACQSMSEKLAKGYADANEAESFSLLLDDLIQQEQNLPKDYMKLDLANPEQYKYTHDKDTIYMIGSQGADASINQKNVIASMGRTKLLDDLRKMIRKKFTTTTLSGPRFTCAKDFSDSWEIADNMNRMMLMFCGPLTQDMSPQEVLELFHNMDIDQSYDGLGMEDDAEQREFCEQVFGDAAARFFTLMQSNMQKVAYAFGDTMIIAHPADMLKQGTPILREFIQSLGIYANTIGGFDDRLMEKYGNNYKCDYDKETFTTLGGITSSLVGVYTQLLTPITDEYTDGSEVDEHLEDKAENKPYTFKAMLEWQEKTPGVKKNGNNIVLAKEYFFAHPELLDPDRVQKVKRKDGGDFFKNYVTTPRILPVINNADSIKMYRAYKEKYNLDYRTLNAKEVANYTATLKKRGYQTMLPLKGKEYKRADKIIAAMKKKDPTFQFELKGNANLDKLYINGFQGATVSQLIDMLSEVKYENV